MCISVKYYIFKIHYNTNKLSRALKQLFNVILYINMMSMIITYFIRNANTFNFPLLMNFYLLIFCCYQFFNKVLLIGLVQKLLPFLSTKLLNFGLKLKETRS